MTTGEEEKLLRDYAAGEISWTSLRGCGIDHHRDVLAGLGRLGLRPPRAPFDEGRSVEVRARARATTRAALQRAGSE